MSGFKLEGTEQMARNISLAQREKLEKLMLALNSVLAEMSNYCKQNGPWADRTANLRNSIGYVPAYYGTADQVLVQTGVVSGFDRIAKRFRRDNRDTLLAPTQSGEESGLTITGVLYAGMEYAVYVEYTDGLWVISGAFSEYRTKIMSLLRERMEAMR